MTDFIISADPPEYRTADRYKLHFTGMTNMVMPFEGSIILPRAAHADDAKRLIDMSDLDHSDWIFYSMLYPRAARPEEIGAEIVFPSLRDIEGKPFALGGARPVAGKVMVLAARGYTLLDDFHGGALFEKGEKFYSPRYPENASLSATPNTFILHMDNDESDLVLPSGAPLPSGDPSPTAPPYHLPQGFSPFVSDNHAVANLKTALENKTFSGEIYAFDIAGNIIDGYALALWLEINNFNVAGPGIGPEADEMFVQLVDAHGVPLDPAGTTMEAIEFDPPLNPVAVGDSRGGLRLVKFPDPAKKELTISYGLPDGGLDTLLVFGKFPYQFRHIRVGLWPGFGHSLKEIVSGGPVVLELDADFPNDKTLPPFVRLCVLHPGDEMPTEAGGEIDLKPNEGKPTDGQAFSKDNDFRLYTAKNAVTVFNTGEAYFADIVLEAESRVGGVLEGVYLTNWKSQPDVFMHGRMVGHGIERSDAKTDEIDEAVAGLIDPDNFIIARLDPVEDPDPVVPPLDPADQEHRYTLITRRPGFNANQWFQMQVEELAAAGAATPFTPVHRAFVRAGGPATWILTGDGVSPHPEFRLAASWKNGVGRVELSKHTLAIPAPSDPAAGLLAFPEDVLALGIDGSDPPKATLRQVRGYTRIRELLVGNTAGGGGNIFDDAGRDLRVLFVHLDSGAYEVIPLNAFDPPVPGDPIDITLHTFERLFCTDEMAVALIDWPGDIAALDLSVHLLTHARTIVYPIIAFEQGELPLSTEELGGWLREMIATRPDLDLRALYWEHTQANLAPDILLERGLSNSAAIAAVLNRSVDGKNGMAIRDRSTRQLASFHQKGVVLVKRDQTIHPDGQTRHKVVAYVGGIDLAHGRWDTEGHYHLDPERQNGSGWRDVQMKIEGDAALDVLKNFTQRWQSLIDFAPSSLCKPVNLVNNMEKKIKVPTHLGVFDEQGPLIQITRTWPPASCHAGVGLKPFVDQNGELGSLESYLKAIRRAKKFILINDQYLFGIEIALAIRKALLRPDGPECAMILLPMNLQEVDIVDPVIFKTRKRAFDALFYGAEFEGGVTPGPNDPHRYKVNPPTGPSLRDRIAIVTPVNRQGDEIYVHSKQMIVDDVFMTIGSANFTFRGATYEMELNAATVDRTLQQGGGVAVREQRIELCRRMLGLPMAYSSMMQDWNACFHMFKAIEKETEPANPKKASSHGSLNLHPLKPMVKQLPPDFAPQLGPEHQGYNDGVSFVMDLDNNSAGMLWLMRNAIDVDGRDTTSDQILIDGAQLFTNIAYLTSDTPYLSEFPHNPPNPYGRLTFDLNPLKPAITNALGGGDTLMLVLATTIAAESGSGDQPFTTEVGRHAVTMVNPPTGSIVIDNMTSSQILVPIHIDRRVDVTAELRTNGGMGAIIGTGAHVFDPATTPNAPGGAPITHGVFINGVVALSAPP